MASLIGFQKAARPRHRAASCQTWLGARCVTYAYVPPFAYSMYLPPTETVMNS